MSIRSLTKDTDYMVGFTSNDCFTHDLTHELMIGKGRQVHNLYVLDSRFLIPAFLNNQNNVVCSSIIDSYTWHNRLGHPSRAKIDNMSELYHWIKQINLDFFLCDVCPKAKQKRFTFSYDSHTSKNIFDIIHIDVWGSFSVITHECYRYFLTIVDNTVVPLGYTF